jgi:predicted metal-binding membrane protein
VHNAPSVAALSRRDRVLIATCIVLIALLAWAYLFHLDRQMSSTMAHDSMMAEMGMSTHAPWTSTDVFFTFAMWTVMMVGMMAAPATPVILLFAATRTGRPDGGLLRAVPMFGAGYLAVWVGFSACATLGQWALHEAMMLSPTMAAAGPHLSGAILLGAGAYQLSPWKGACLTHCRTPLGFLMANWRDGMFGAFKMGVRHGAYCVGCCWALMCVLFVVGVMNLVWVAALTVFVLVEKVAPAGGAVARVAGVASILAGTFRMGGIL